MSSLAEKSRTLGLARMIADLATEQRLKVCFIHRDIRILNDVNSSGRTGKILLQDEDGRDSGNDT